MQVIEGGRCICAGDLSQYNSATWVSINKVSQVVDLVIDDAPQRVLGVVLRDLVPGEVLFRGVLRRFWRHVGIMCAIQQDGYKKRTNWAEG